MPIGKIKQEAPKLPLEPTPKPDVQSVLAEQVRERDRQIEDFGNRTPSTRSGSNSKP